MAPIRRLAPWLIALVATVCTAGTKDAIADDAGASSTTLLPAEKLVLPNGLVVVLVESHRAPEIALRIDYSTGTIDDPEDARGLGAVIARLLTDGASRHIDKHLRKSLLEAQKASWKGGDANAGIDQTWMTTVVPSNELAVALWLEAERMGFLAGAVDENVVRAAVTEIERDLGSKSDRRYANVDSLMRDALFGSAHPYGHSLPDFAALHEVHAEGVRARLAERYAPDHAMLVIAGDIDRAETKKLVESTFGKLGASKTQLAPTTFPATPTGERHLRIEAGVKNRELVVGWVTAKYMSADDLTLDCLAKVLTWTRLKRSLVTPGIARSAWAHQSSFMGASDFTISVELLDGHTAEEALTIVDREVAELVANGPTAEETAFATRQRRAEIALAFESPDNASAFLSSYVRTGKPVTFASDHLTTLAGITAADLQRVAKFPSERLITEVVPTHGAPPAGRVKR